MDHILETVIQIVNNPNVDIRNGVLPEIPKIEIYSLYYPYNPENDQNYWKFYNLDAFNMGCSGKVGNADV